MTSQEGSPIDIAHAEKQLIHLSDLRDRLVLEQTVWELASQGNQLNSFTRELFLQEKVGSVQLSDTSVHAENAATMANVLYKNGVEEAEWRELPGLLCRYKTAFQNLIAGNNAMEGQHERARARLKLEEKATEQALRQMLATAETHPALATIALLRDQMHDLFFNNYQRINRADVRSVRDTIAEPFDSPFETIVKRDPWFPAEHPRG